MRTQLSDKTRSDLLIVNRHSCCVCHEGGVQIHHIDSDPSNNGVENLAVLCLNHHDKATSPKGLSAKLKPAHIKQYKTQWEEECRSLEHRIARSRTAFFMVDYKNAERIRQLYSQLTPAERAVCYDALRKELQEETSLRKEQGFSVSLEPNLSVTPPVEQFLEEIPSGTIHPDYFKDFTGHPKDPLYPDVHAFEGGGKPYYDIWCQMMIRCLIIVRRTIDIESVMQLDEDNLALLAGSIVSFDGRLRGNVQGPNNYEEVPISNTVLRVKFDCTIALSRLSIKNHYVYSETAAESLSHGRGNGIALLRDVYAARATEKCKTIKFNCTPLIIGSGGGKALSIP